MNDKITREDLKKELSRIIGESKNKIRDRYEQAREVTKEKREKVDKYVKENPEKSVLTGAGVGFLIGILIAFIFSRKK